jgi:hypothetical protein
MEKPEQLLFKIDAFTPTTLPMARLAAYLEQLASLLGSEERVHFERLKKGSAVVQARVEGPAVPKVFERLTVVNKPEAPQDVTKAYKELNLMLRRDNAVGTLKKLKGGTIVAFPGRKTPITEAVKVVEAGSLEGILFRVGGRDDTLPVWIKDAEGVDYFCFTRDRQVARQIASYYLGPPVRVHGTGYWERTPDDVWKLDRFDIKSFEALEDLPLSKSVENIRAAKGNEWDELDDPLAYLRRIRSGE